MIRRPPRSTQSRSSAASDVYKRQVEEDAVGGVQTVGFPVVHADPVGVELGRAVGGAGVEGGGLLLRCLLHLSKHLAGGGLVETGLLLQPQDAYGLQEAQGAQGI